MSYNKYEPSRLVKINNGDKDTQKSGISAIICYICVLFKNIQFFLILMKELLSLLKRFFGYTSFRPLQAETHTAHLAERRFAGPDGLLGGGKSDSVSSFRRLSYAGNRHRSISPYRSE